MKNDPEVIKDLNELFGNLSEPPKEKKKAKEWLKQKYRGIFKEGLDKV